MNFVGRDLTPAADPRPTRRRGKEDWLRALQRTAGVTLASSRTMARVVDEWAARHPARPALSGEDESLSFGDLAASSHRYARWALDRGLECGDGVALTMANTPSYAAIWIGLSSVGVVTALINTQLVGESLASCLSIAKPKHIIADAAGLDALDAYLRRDPDAYVWEHGGGARAYPRIDLEIQKFSSDPLQSTEAPAVTLSDTALLIYTSGTTGLPKAARVSHYRAMMWSEWFAGIMDAQPEDRLYNCLPMYHSVGGIVAVGALLVAGGSVVVRRSFSASRFWADIAQSRATIFQYIGDLCRYLLNAPDIGNAPAHALRLCCGNGLRGDVWEAFQEKFDIPRIIEFYAATEGTFSLFNVEGEPGAIGRIPSFLAHNTPIAVVKFDIDSEKPRRDERGFCLRCAVDEPGEAIGRIDRGPAKLATRFEGYTNDSETERKILRDVFEEGDAWFRTGDLMRRDARGFFYFVDRIGDTFRWKGENVSASEVTDVLCRAGGVLQATVYGVAVPHADGRAGMAALVVDRGFDLAAFGGHVSERLARYARPLFLRIRDDLAITGTFRAKKADLVSDGFDPASIGDALYRWHHEQGRYQRLDRSAYAAIVSGDVKL